MKKIAKHGVISGVFQEGQTTLNEDWVYGYLKKMEKREGTIDE